MLATKVLAGLRVAFTGDFDLEGRAGGAGGALPIDLLRLMRVVYAGGCFSVLALVNGRSGLAFSGDLALDFLASGFLIDLLGDKDF